MLLVTFKRTVLFLNVSICNMPEITSFAALQAMMKNSRYQRKNCKGVTKFFKNLSESM